MSKEAMKLALEALEHLQPTALTSFYTIGDRDKAITALRKALAEPDFWEGYVPEPVKPAQQLVDCHATGVCVQSGLRAEQPAQQEPVACPYCHNSHTLGAVYFDQNCVGCVKRMTTPPQRTWVGLTDEQKEALSQDAEGNPWAAVELAETKLKELNT